MSIHVAASLSHSDIGKRLGLARPAGGYGSVIPHFNAAPGWVLPAFVRIPGAEATTLDHGHLYWGAIPSYATKPDGRRPTVRVDQAGHRRWRRAFELRRAVVGIGWAYVFRQERHGVQPYAIRPAGNTDGFLVAGVWSYPRTLAATHEYWRNQRTLALVTTEAHASICRVSGRMPAALTDASAREWLADGNDLPSLIDRLRAGDVGPWEYWACSSAVRQTRNRQASVAAAVWRYAELAVPGVTVGPDMRGL